MLWCVLRQLHGEFPCPTNIVDMMAVFLTMSLSFLTKISASSQRLLLSSCLLFSLVIMCVLQSSHPHFQSDLDTLQKRDVSELPVVTLDPILWTHLMSLQP
jgi:hypothetical protein